MEDEEEDDPLATTFALPPLGAAAADEDEEELAPPMATGWRVNLIVVGDVADKLLCNVVLCDLCDDDDPVAAAEDDEDEAPPLEDDEEDVEELFACLAFSAVAWLPPPEECADFSISASKSSSSSGMPPIFHSSSYSKFVSFDSLELELLDEESDEEEELHAGLLPASCFVFVCFLIALELLLLLCRLFADAAVAFAVAFVLLLKFSA